MYANVSGLGPVVVLEKEQGLGLGLGLATSCLGLGLGLATACLGLGLGLAGQGLGLGLGLVKKCLGHITEYCYLTSAYVSQLFCLSLESFPFQKHDIK